MQQKCINRLNLIKILSHRTWKLIQKTLLSVYRSLVGSVLDYNFFILPFLSDTNIKKIQAIQNKAVRSIFKLRLDPDTQQPHNTAFLNTLSNLPSVSDRMLVLKNNYIAQAQANNNPLICPLIKNYKRNTSTIDKNGSPKLLTGAKLDLRDITNHY